jgi:hypothetical protein
MSDITMCLNVECPLRQKCRRYQADPDPIKQAYSVFEPEPKWEGKYRVSYWCRHLIPQEQNDDGSSR